MTEKRVSVRLVAEGGRQVRAELEGVGIARPSALVPTTAFEQMQLRLTQFYSPAGLSQIGARVEVAATEDGFGTPLFTRTILGEVSSYTTLHPEDGLVPGQAFWWRALYYGTEGQQSDWSTPFRQTYPAFITPPCARHPRRHHLGRGRAFPL